MTVTHIIDAREDKKYFILQFGMSAALLIISIQILLGTYK